MTKFYKCVNTSYRLKSTGVDSRESIMIKIIGIIHCIEPCSAEKWIKPCGQQPIELYPQIIDAGLLSRCPGFKEALI